MRRVQRIEGRRAHLHRVLGGQKIRNGCASTCIRRVFAIPDKGEPSAGDNRIGHGVPDYGARSEARPSPKGVRSPSRDREVAASNLNRGHPRLGAVLWTHDLLDDRHTDSPGVYGPAAVAQPHESELGTRELLLLRSDVRIMKL